MLKKCRIRSKIYLAGLLCSIFPSLGVGNLPIMQLMKKEAETKFITFFENRGILALDWKNDSGKKHCIFGRNRISLSKEIFNPIFSDTIQKHARQSKIFEENSRLLQEDELVLSTLKQSPNSYEKLDESLLLDQNKKLFVHVEQSVAISPESLFVSEKKSLSKNISPEMLLQSKQQVYSMIKNNQAPIVTGEERIYIPLDEIEEEQVKKELALMELTRPFVILYYSLEFIALSDSIEKFLSEKTILPFVRVLNTSSQKPLLNQVFQKKFSGTKLPLLMFVSGGWAMGPQEEDKQHLRFSAKSIGNGDLLSSFFVKGELNKFLFSILKLRENESERKFFKP